MKKFFEILGLIAVSLVAGAYLQKCQNPQQAKPPELPGVVLIDTIPYYDTIAYYLPDAKQEVSLGNRIAFLPVFIPKDSAGSGAEAPAQGQINGRGARDSTYCAYGTAVTMTALHDSVAVEIPITQRKYEGKEYHAWVSGYDPKLDSIFVFPRREVITIREPPNKQKRWGIGVFAGYGITPQGLQPCAGISVNYTLWNL